MNLVIIPQFLCLTSYIAVLKIYNVIILNNNYYFKSLNHSLFPTDFLKCDTSQKNLN